LAFPHTNAFVKKTLVKSYEEVRRPLPVLLGAQALLPNYRPSFMQPCQMTASLNSILLDGLKCEVDSNNLQALLWTASVYAHASIDHNASFCNDLIRFILQRMLLIGAHYGPFFSNLQGQEHDSMKNSAYLLILLSLRRLQASRAGPMK